MNPLALFALLGLGFGAMDHKTDRLERAAAFEIANQLDGNDKSVSVTAVPNGLAGAFGHLDTATVTARQFIVKELPFYTEPWRSKAGRIGTLKISLHDFTIARLRVDELSAEVPNCRYDVGLAIGKGRFRVSQSGEGWGWVKVSQEALAEYIVERFPEIESANVRIFDDVLWIEGNGTFLIAKTNFTVIASLSIGDGTRLLLKDAKVYFDWKRADHELVKVVLQTLNPVIDISTDLGLLNALTVKEIRLRDGVLVASGTARIPVKPGGRPTDNEH